MSHGVRSPLTLPSSSHIFYFAMAKTNSTNPNTTMPSLRRNGKDGAGTARASTARRQKKPAAVPRSLRKPPPESLLEAQGAPDMPSRVARPRAYPSRNNRTPSTNPPAVVICNEEHASGDVSVLNFRSPTLPPFASGIPDAFLHEDSGGLDIDFAERATLGGGDNEVDDNLDRTRKGKAASRTRKGKPTSC